MFGMTFQIFLKCIPTLGTLKYIIVFLLISSSKICLLENKHQANEKIKKIIIYHLKDNFNCQVLSIALDCCHTMI